jgi:hypothetical protein
MIRIRSIALLCAISGGPYLVNCRGWHIVRDKDDMHSTHGQLAIYLYERTWSRGKARSTGRKSQSLSTLSPRPRRIPYCNKQNSVLAICTCEFETMRSSRYCCVHETMDMRLFEKTFYHFAASSCTLKTDPRLRRELCSQLNKKCVSAI